MKKILIILMSILFITGCGMTKDLNNTPTKKVEEYLNKYQSLHEDVIKDLDTVLTNDKDFNENQKKEYKEIIKKNYQKMTYKIKNEEIDGDKATVTAEIDVIDYTTKILEIEKYYNENKDKFEKETDETKKYSQYRIDEIKKVTDKKTYTVDFELTKNKDKWELNNPSTDIVEKINGMYK
ncbi:MAG: hypothetical protein RSB77_02025 [Bacilli bacterium]